MSSVWAIIPVKPLASAKSRLANTLTQEQRERFAENMLRRTLRTVTSVPQIAGTLVISRDSYVLAVARDMGAHTVVESGAPELNNALMRATGVLGGRRAGAVLILPADIPLINSEDLLHVIALGRDPLTVVIVTDHENDGTNVMLVRPPGLFHYAYGPGSREKHIQLAEAAGATVKTYQSDELLLDIDTPADLARYNHLIQTTDVPLPIYIDGANELN